MGQRGRCTCMCPYGTRVETSRTHIIGEGEVCQEERDGSEGEMRKIDVWDMEQFGRSLLEEQSSEETIAIQGDRWWSQTTKPDGDRICAQFLCNIWRSAMSAQMLEVFPSGVGTMLRLKSDWWFNGQIAR